MKTPDYRIYHNSDQNSINKNRLNKNQFLQKLSGRLHSPRTKRGAALFLALGLGLESLCACSGTGLPGQDSDSAQTSKQQTLESPTPKEQEAIEEFDALCQDLFLTEVTEDSLTLHYTLAEPASLGIAMDQNTFGEFSMDKSREDVQECKEYAKKLSAIEKKYLPEEKSFLYDVLTEKLSMAVEAEKYPYYYDPLQPSIGLQAELPILLAEYPFRTEGDIRNYLELLGDMDRYYQDILSYEKEKAAKGLFMSDEVLKLILSDCDSYLEEEENHVLIRTFEERIDEFEGLSEEEKKAYKEENTKLVKDHVLKAYKELSTGLAALKGSGSNDQGLAGFPKGKDYYMYLMKCQVGTDRSSKAIAEMINARIKEDLDFIHEKLQDNPELAKKANSFSFSISDPQAILDDILGKMGADFPTLDTQVQYEFKYVAKELEDSLSPAFYLTPPVDALKENVIYINKAFTDQSSLYATLAHEGFPGHLYQTISTFESSQEDHIRKICNLNGYAEGWATYAEYFSYQYDTGNDPLVSELAMRNNRINLGVYALLDYYVNYENYSFDEMTEWLTGLFSTSNKEAMKTLYYTLVSQPTNYMNYYFGYLEIEELSRQVQAALGSKFTYKDFHQFILEYGDAPFYIIREHMKDWLK